MKIQFDATQLAKQLRLLKVALSPSKGVASENLIGIGAKDGKLIVYGYSNMSWVRIVINCPTLDSGSVAVDRIRFFRVLDSLKGEEVMCQTKGNHLQLTTLKKKGTFTLLTSLATNIPRARLSEEIRPQSLNIKALRDQLHLNVLDGELAGGGYKIKGNGRALSITATDRQRLVETNQPSEVQIDLLIHSTAMRGVFEVLKETQGEVVDVRTTPNQTSMTVTIEDISVEFGYTNSSATFPSVSKILGFTEFPNTAQFETSDLIEAINRADTLAEKELPFADFNFDSEICTLEAFSGEGSVELKLDCPAEIEEESTKVLRLQLPHLKSLLNKAKSFGADWVHCKWGEKLPVRWMFDFEDTTESAYKEIDMVYITAALNRNA